MSHSPAHRLTRGIRASRRWIPRSPRLERAAFCALVLAIAGLPFDEGPKFFFTFPLAVVLVATVARGLRTWRWPIRLAVIDGRRVAIALPLLLIGVWAVASLLWSESPRHTRNLLWRDLGRGVAMLLLVASYVNTIRRAQFAVFAFALGVAVCAVTGVVERISYADVGQYRVFGTFGHPNHCANLLGAGIAILAALPRRGGRDLVWRIIVLAPALVTLFFTLSRGAWFGTTVALVVVGTLRNRRMLVVAGALAVGVVLVARFAPGGYLGERVRDLFERDRFVKALHHRPEIWAGAWEMVKSRPIHGHGYGYKNFHVVWAKRVDKPGGELYNAAHNTPLHIAFELGVIGLLLFAWLYWIVGRSALRGYRRTADPWSRGLLAGLIGIGVGWSVQAFTVEHILLEQMMPIIGSLSGLAIAVAGFGAAPTGE